MEWSSLFILRVLVCIRARIYLPIYGLPLGVLLHGTTLRVLVLTLWRSNTDLAGADIRTAEIQSNVTYGDCCAADPR